MPAHKGTQPKNSPRGRRKGSLNKTTKVFKEAVLRAYDAIGGDKAFAAWAKENLTDYYRIAARMIPQEHSGPGGGPIAVDVHDHFDGPPPKVNPLNP